MSLDPQKYPNILNRVPTYATICAEQHDQLCKQLKMLEAGGAMPEGIECVQTDKGVIVVCRVNRLSAAGKVWLRQMCLDAGWHDVEFSDYRNGYEQLEHQVALSYIDKT